MKVLRDKVIRMAEHLGYRTAKSWNKPKMAEKLKEIATLAGEDKLAIEDDEESAALLKQVVSMKGEMDVVQNEADLVETPAGAADVNVETTETTPASTTVATELAKTEPPKKTPGPRKPPERTAPTKEQVVASVIRDSNYPTTVDELVAVAYAKCLKEGTSKTEQGVVVEVKYMLRTLAFFGLYKQEGQIVSKA